MGREQMDQLATEQARDVDYGCQDGLKCGGVDKQKEDISHFTPTQHTHTQEGFKLIHTEPISRVSQNLVLYLQPTKGHRMNLKQEKVT